MADEQDRPSQATWRRLYEAATAFKESACWEWMWDSDLFGVKNPSTGEIGYCCVLGRLGEVLGMGLYPGSEGLDCYLAMASSEAKANDPETLFNQLCLTLFFCDRNELDKTDLSVIRSLGLSFRGRDAWPKFRGHRPGYYPWYLTEAEASYLAVVLEQAVGVALRYRETPELLDSPTPVSIFVRVAEQKEGQLEWRDEWLQPTPLKKREVSFEPLDETRVARIKEKAVPSDTAWEGDFFYLDMPVAEGNRPYFRRVFLWMESSSGLILGQELTAPDEPITPLREVLLNLVEEVGACPGEIHVRTDEAIALLAPVAASLRIKLVKAKALRAVKDFRRSALKYLQGFPGG